MKHVFFLLIILVPALPIGCDKAKAAESVSVAEKELSAEQKFNLAERCAIAGKKYFDDKMKASDRNWDSGNPVTQGYWEPEFHYNSRLNTCLIYEYSAHYLRSGGDSKITHYYHAVIDVFSNTELVGISRTNMREFDPALLITDFYEQKLKLFDE